MAGVRKLWWWTWFEPGAKYYRAAAPQCPYDELEISRRFPNTPMSLPARLLLCEGYRRADAIWYMYNDNPQYDRHDDAHQTAQALACGEFE